MDWWWWIFKPWLPGPRVGAQIWPINGQKRRTTLFVRNANRCLLRTSELLGRCEGLFAVVATAFWRGTKMKLFAGMTAAVLVAVMAQGCGGEDVEDAPVNTGATGGTSGGTGGSGGTAEGGTGGTEETGPDKVCGDNDCFDYNDPTLSGFLQGGLPACCAGDGDVCGLDVTAAESFFTGLTGCMELNQPAHANSPGDCEGLNMSVQALGEIARPACCRESGTWGVNVSIKGLGETLNFPLTEGAEFGCVDPLPFLGGVEDPSTLPESWKDAEGNAVTEAPACG